MFGAGIIRWSGMVTVGENCNFDALPSLVLITKILIPIIIGIPATFLIPNVLQTEPLINWESMETDEQERSELLASSEVGDSTNGGVGLFTCEDDDFYFHEIENMDEGLHDLQTRNVRVQCPTLPPWI